MKKILLILFNLSLVILLIILVEDGFRHTTEPEPELITANQKEEDPSILKLLENDSPELFDKSSLKDHFKEGQRIDESQIKSIDSLLGNFDSVTKISDRMGAASGWFYSDEDEVDFILFINKENKVLGAGLIGIERPGLSEAIGKKSADFAGWVGFINFNDNMQKVHAISKFKNKDGFYNIGSLSDLNSLQNNDEK